MARHEHLPIYKAALDLTVHLEKVVAGFSRYHKYTLGTELRQGSRAVLQQVVRANYATNAAERAAGRASSARTNSPSTTGYATALPWRPQTALLVNERTLLRVLIALATTGRTRIRVTLNMHGAPCSSRLALLHSSNSLHLTGNAGAGSAISSSGPNSA